MHSALDNLMEPQTPKPADLENITEPPILSLLSSSSYETHQDNMNGLTKNKESDNPDQVLLHGHQMDQNPINPKLPPTPKPFGYEQIKTPMMCGHNCMKMSGYRIIGSNNLFLLDSYHDGLNFDLNLTMIGTI